MTSSSHPRDSSIEQGEWLAQTFDEHRPQLRDVAERILGSDEAVNEAWLRLSLSDANPAVDLAERLAAVVTRVCPDRLSSRTSRPALAWRDDRDPHMLLADSLGLALVTTLESLASPERLAFVLHELFGLPLRATASRLGQPVGATEELINRARARLRGALPLP